MGSVNADGVYVYDTLDQVTPLSTLLNLQASALTNKVQDLESDINDKEDAIDDTGWVNLSFVSPFTNYNTDSGPRIRRIGNVVYLTGGAASGQSGIGFVASTTMLNIPSQFRPTGYPRVFVCQGSGYNRWVLQANDDGVVTFARYSDGDNTATTGSNNWLPFDVNWCI